METSLGSRSPRLMAADLIESLPRYSGELHASETKRDYQNANSGCYHKS